MFRFGVCFCCLLALALGQQNNNGYQVPPGSVYNQGFVQPQNPQFVSQPFFQTIDKYYCSALASFPLWSTISTGSSGYGNEFVQRQMTRKTCRFSANHSFKSCTSCCQKASRLRNSNVEEIYGTLFFFNPNTPPFEVATNSRSGPYGESTSPADPVVIDAATGIAQCLCCTKQIN